MPDIKQVFQVEIRRLARKEIRLATQALTQTVTMLRRQLGEQKKTICALQKQLAAAPSPFQSVKASSGDAAAPAVKVRLNAKGIVRIRKKLKLTQEKFAALINVATHTVSLWEQGKTSPRSAQKNRICALRTIGKRELKKQLAAVPGGIAPKAEKAPKAVKAPKAPKAKKSVKPEKAAEASVQK